MHHASKKLRSSGAAVTVFTSSVGIIFELAKTKAFPSAGKASRV